MEGAESFGIRIEGKSFPFSIHDFSQFELRGDIYPLLLALRRAIDNYEYEAKGMNPNIIIVTQDIFHALLKSDYGFTKRPGHSDVNDKTTTFCGIELIWTPFIEAGHIRIY